MAGCEQSPNAGGEYLHGGDRLVRALGILQAERVFGAPETRDAFLQELDSGRMIRLLDWANGMVRGVPAVRPGLADPSQSSVVVNFATERPSIVYVPPPPEERPGLLTDLLEATKAASTPEDQGLLMGLGINIVHLRDGTGRMARLADSLHTRGYDGSAEDKLYYTALLENTEGRLLLDLQTRPLLNARYGDRIASELWQEAGYLGDAPTEVHAPDIDFVIDEYALADPKKLATLLCHEESLSTANVLAIIRETGRAVEDYLRLNRENDTLALDGMYLTENIRPDEAEAVKGAHILIKRGFLGALIQCLRDGEESIFGPIHSIRRRYAPVDRPFQSLPPSVSGALHTYPPDQLPRRQPGAHFAVDPTLDALRRVTETMKKSTEGSSENDA